MAVAHNVYIRGMNAIYLQADGVTSASDIQDFLIFCKIWIEIIDHHHRIEEEVFFTNIEDAMAHTGLMAKNVEQHHAFEKGMTEFARYIRAIKAEDYDGKVLKGHIDKFAIMIVEHLHEEIETLLSLKEYDPEGDALTSSYNKFERKLVASSSWTRHHPFILGCHDVTFEDGVNRYWPAVPVIIPYGISWFLSRKLKGVWRFLPSDFHGNPRELPFLPEKLVS